MDRLCFGFRAWGFAVIVVEITLVEGFMIVIGMSLVLPFLLLRSV